MKWVTLGSVVAPNSRIASEDPVRIRHALVLSEMLEPGCDHERFQEATASLYWENVDEDYFTLVDFSRLLCGFVIGR